MTRNSSGKPKSGRIYAWRPELEDRTNHSQRRVKVTCGPLRGRSPAVLESRRKPARAHLSERIAEFLESAEELLEDPEVKEFLRGELHIEDAGASDRLKGLFGTRSQFLPKGVSDPSSIFESLGERAMERLIAFLANQKEATGRPLPHRRHLLIEHIGSAPGGYPGNQIVLHTIWGGRINRPFAMALEAAWEARYGYRPEFIRQMTPLCSNSRMKRAARRYYRL